MKNLILLFFFMFVSFFSNAQTGYKIGDKVAEFSLLNASTNTSISLKDYADAKVVVIIFTSHTCPYMKIYEQRLKTLEKDFEGKGVKVIFINPNNAQNNPDESAVEMAKAAVDRGYGYPYLVDSNQEVTDKFGASKTPEIFVLRNQTGGFILKYKGAIDDNPQVAAEVQTSYVNEAIIAALGNQPVKITEKRATGCMIHR